ncbi:MAG: hypothetical protein IPM54_42400 [Polyangiaceae bacterium]|nr:hypothetical protein [Polyangiaceae bacterium]
MQSESFVHSGPGAGFMPPPPPIPPPPPEPPPPPIPLEEDELEDEDEPDEDDEVDDELLSSTVGSHPNRATIETIDAQAK